MVAMPEIYNYISLFYLFFCIYLCTYAAWRWVYCDKPNILFSLLITRHIIIRILSLLHPHIHMQN